MQPQVPLIPLMSNHQMTFPSLFDGQFSLDKYQPQMTGNRLSKRDIEIFFQYLYKRSGRTLKMTLVKISLILIALTVPISFASIFDDERDPSPLFWILFDICIISSLITLLLLSIKGCHSTESIQKFLQEHNETLQIEKNMHWSYQKDNQNSQLILNLDFKKQNFNDFGEPSSYLLQYDLLFRRFADHDYDSSITSNRISKETLQEFLNDVAVHFEACMDQEGTQIKKFLIAFVISLCILLILLFKLPSSMSWLKQILTYLFFVGLYWNCWTLFKNVKKAQAQNKYSVIIEEANRTKFQPLGIKFFNCSNQFLNLEMVLYYKYQDDDDVEFFRDNRGGQGQQLGTDQHDVVDQSLMQDVEMARQ